MNIGRKKFEEFANNDKSIIGRDMNVRLSTDDDRFADGSPIGKGMVLFIDDDGFIIGMVRQYDLYDNNGNLFDYRSA